MSQILFTSLSPDELKALIVEAFSSSTVEIKKSIEQQTIEKEHYLTRQEACKILQISLPTLHDYTTRGLIKSYRIGTKIRYKVADIDAALVNRNFGRR